MLSTWQNEKVVFRIKHAEKSLNFSSLKLHKLPIEIGVLTHIRSLDLSENQLTFLPSEIGLLTKLTYLSLRNNRLTALPTEIGLLKRLHEFPFDNNRVTALPTEIGQLVNLTSLQFWNNQVTSFPTEIGLLKELTILHFSNNQLASLPTEIGQLTKLFSFTPFRNRLTSLPTEIGLLTRLRELPLTNNRLASLPPQIGLLTHLFKLNITQNPSLTHLPMSLGENQWLMTLEIEGTAVPQAELDAILQQCRSIRDKEAREVLPLRLAKWAAYAASPQKLNIDSFTENQQGTLNEWLLRLEKTKDFAMNQSLLAKTVCGILDDIENPDFKDLFFNQAEANNECCEDRSAMALNEIYTAWLLLCKPANTAILPGIAKTLRLRKTIDALIRKNKREERESVEIFLYYETALRDVLNLETAIQRMSFGMIGKREWIDQEALIKDVNENYYEELIAIPIFEKIMEERWKPVHEEFQAKLASLGECPEGGDEETPVLEFQALQGKIMAEWKNKKIETAKLMFQ